MGVQAVRCADAGDFLARLDPLGDLGAEFQVGAWVFRGQADATWHLTPSSLRNGQRLSFEDPSVRGPLEGTVQRMAELHLLAAFVAFADELAFSLPGDLSRFLIPWAQHEGVAHVQLNASWPPADLVQLAAIAQHHGVPTRLLDFTSNPLVAAYFAACEVHQGASELAVWAVNIGFVHQAWPPFRRGVRVVQVPRAPNPFLHAQDGLFLYDAEDTRTPLDDRILACDVTHAEHLRSTERDRVGELDRIRLLTLPSSERQALLTLLARRRITRARLQPTLDNVVGELKARW